jgi:hypothetical protein
MLIQKQFPGGMAQIHVEDPDQTWAVSRLRETP